MMSLGHYWNTVTSINGLFRRNSHNLDKLNLGTKPILTLRALIALSETVSFGEASTFDILAEGSRAFRSIGARYFSDLALAYRQHHCHTGRGVCTVIKK
jgi:hypothetical protein